MTRFKYDKVPRGLWPALRVCHKENTIVSQASLQTLETINKEYELRKGQIMDNTKSHHLDWLTFFFFFFYESVDLCQFSRL